MTFFTVSILNNSGPIACQGTYSPNSSLDFVATLHGRGTKPKTVLYEYFPIEFGKIYALYITSSGSLASSNKYFTIKKIDGTELSATQENIREILNTAYAELNAK
jgi:hypothetical protein